MSHQIHQLYQLLRSDAEKAACDMMAVLPESCKNQSLEELENYMFHKMINETLEIIKKGPQYDMLLAVKSMGF
jgi:hypothetical protein